MGMFYQGNTFDEISGLIGMNAATVRGHFLRGRRKLLVHICSSRAPHLLGRDRHAEFASQSPGIDNPTGLNAGGDKRHPNQNRLGRTAMLKAPRT